MKKYYTVGFLFSSKLDRVALLEKQRPEWQRGKLNGIGGHVEEGETPSKCMEREFKEEVAYPEEITWTGFAKLIGSDFEVFCFAAKGEPNLAVPRTDESVVRASVSLITPDRTDIIENLPWLLYLAIDSLTDGRPAYSYIEYP